MKVLKILSVVVLLLVIAVAGGAYYLSRNLPQIVTDLVEKHGSEATGTAVTLGDIDFNFLSGRVALQDLVIANPKGFTTPNAFELNNLVFHINLKSLTEEVVNIEEFKIEGVSITAEQVGKSLKTNLQTISDNVKRQNRTNQQAAKKKTAPKEEDTGSTGGTEPLVIVQKFDFTDNSLDLVSEQWGDRTINIPSIELRDIGKKEGGLTPEQLTTQVMEAITSQANEAVKRELRTMAEEEAKKKLSSKVKDKFNSWFKK